MLDNVQSSQVELVLDTYRVSGNLAYLGGPRRLVDILNNAGEPFVLMRDACVDDPLRSDDTPREFDVVQVHLNTVLFAIPHGASIQAKDPLETVRKIPIAATIAMPGFEIAGNIHLLPELEPENAQILGARHYIPMTDACITSAFTKDVIWRPEVVVVNLARAVLFAPHERSASSIAQSA
jgi:hypothetical protein